MSTGFFIRAIRNKLSIALLTCLLVHPVVYSQMTVSIDQQYDCESTDVLVPVAVSNFVDVSAITLYIEIDTTVLHYEACLNPNSMLDGGMIMDSFSGTNGDHVITITWSRLTPVSIVSGKLFDLKLSYKGGTSALQFTNCEIALSDLSVAENVVYNNGSILPMEITGQPQNVSAKESDPVTFTISYHGATDLLWQHNSGNGWIGLSDNESFSGTHTNELIITNVPKDFDNHLFRCVISLTDCYLISDSAILLVTPLGISSNNEKQSVITVYPNPCSEKLNIMMNTSLRNTGIQLLNLLGESVYQSFSVDLNEGSLQSIYINDLQSGIYFLQLKNDHGVFYTVKILKQ